MRSFPPTDALRAIGDAIHVDEIGIRTGRWRDYFIKSAYRPLYAPRGGRLERSALEASVLPIRDGRRRTAAQLWTEAGAERGPIEALSLALHVGNHANGGDDDARLLLDCRIRDDRHAMTVLATVSMLPQLCAGQALRPEEIVCFVGSARDASFDLVEELARTVAASGMRVALDDFGAGRDVPSILQKVRPDMVRLDPDLVGAVRQVKQGRALLSALVDSLHEGGMEVAFGPIASPSELDMALAAGVDLMGGPLLGEPKLAGALLDGDTIDLAQRQDNVVYLRR